MPTQPHRSLVRGSEKAPWTDARAVGPVPADERFEVTVRVRRQTSLESLAVAGGFHADTPPEARRYLTREQYAAQHGASAADLERVAAFAREHGLVVVETSAERRSVFLSGTAAAFAAAFGTTIEHYEHDSGTYRGRTGPLTVPADLAEVIEGVFGIDNRPIAKTHFQRQVPPTGFQFHAAGSSFTPPELAKLYNFPAADGTGQCIGILELGGGYRTTDIKAYFQQLHLPVPQVTTVRVDNGSNHPTTANGPDGEVMLDIEVAAAVAPKARIAVYFTPNTDKGFLDALTLAIHDKVNKPSVISISWGSAESNWTAQAKTSFDQACQTAAALGVTILAAAGDNGSSDGETDGKAHVDFPASSPFVLGCGGTRVTAAGGTLAKEVVWNDGPQSATGGGVSDFFPLPSYQATAGVPPSANSPAHNKGRGVPDVSGNADPATGYAVRVDGQQFVIGGTSAVAPLWAGLLALINQQLGHPVGFLNPLLYGSLAGAQTLRDITAGNNGAYSAKAGWDACTGLGSPNGVKTLQALQASAHVAVAT